MRKILTLLTIVLTVSLAAMAVHPAQAQRNGGDLSGALERLQDDPRYQGRIIGTQIRRTERGALYEVQILRSDDRVIVVYIDPNTGGVIDPNTGGVVGDSGRRGGSDKASPGRGRGNR